MGEAIEKRGGHFRISKDRRPIGEDQIRGDDDTGALIKFAQTMEEQGTARGAERQASRLIQDHRIGFHQRLSALPCVPWAFSCAPRQM